MEPAPGTGKANPHGVCIFESNRIEAASRYSLNWSAAMDLDLSVVLDGAETRAIGKSRQ